MFRRLIIHFDGIAPGEDRNYAYLTYNRGFWHSSFAIHLYYDEQQVCFSVQGQSRGKGGFIDLGGTECLPRRIKDEIELLLV
jgi:hypothetical protein